ncbi:MAG: septum formation initiator family protein [Vicinamibacterales bacterium]
MSRREQSAAVKVGPPGGSASIARSMLYCILLIATGGLVLNSVVGENGVLARLRAARQIDELRASLEAIRAENKRLREEVDRLQNDPSAVEEIARRELGLIRPGEKLFIIGDEPKH